MSILLAVIVLILLSIAESLKTTAKLDQKKLIYLEKGFYTDKQHEKKLGRSFFQKCNILNN